MALMPWEQTLACEPAPRLILEGEAIDGALAAMGDFADLASPYLVGHSAGVARAGLRGGAARCGVEVGDLPALRRAALVHDVGRVAVPVRDLAEARAADGRRVGAGQAARLPLRAHPVPLAVPGRAHPGRDRPP